MHSAKKIFEKLGSEDISKKNSDSLSKLMQIEQMGSEILKDSMKNTDDI